MIVRISILEGNEWKDIVIGEFDGEIKFSANLLHIIPKNRLGGVFEIKKIEWQEPKPKRGRKKNE